MSESELRPGDIVAGLVPGEHAEVREVRPFGGKTLVVGVTLQTRTEIRRPLDAEELAGLSRVRGADYTYDGDAEAFLLGVEAHRIGIAYQFDPLFAVNSSVVDILPHQVEAVYRYLLPLPRIRFLLADDTGAGKTIMAGLLIKELLFRGVLDKVLIITPGGLTNQWQEDEMQEKFGLSFRLVNRASFLAEPGQFARDEGFFITSIDYISRHEGCLSAATDTQWDMVVVDEAHKLSAYEYGSKVDRSKRYSAVEAIARNTDHLLFLTATPHRGRRDTFRRLLMLLDPDLFQKDEYVTQRVHEEVAQYAGDEAFEGEAAVSGARNRFFLRRLKEEMLDWDDGPLFKPRHTRTVGYELTPEELELYEAVTTYVRSRRKEAKAKRNRYVALTLMVMQRRLASSIYAITRTLQNRLARLDEVLKILRDPTLTPAQRKRELAGATEDVPEGIAEYEALNEAQRAEVDERIFRQVLTADPAEIEAERAEVARLLVMAQALSGHQEAKFAELLKVLDSSDVIRSDTEKLLIFTEHRDTLESLAERLKDRGYSVVTIHGQMDVDARREAQRQFKTRAKIMVATDAAGEGINLQFCRYLINWDIPWNPNRLEQRMGRVHRYGQPDDVWVYNLVAINTREGAVLERVLTKLDTMREQMGDDRVYDVIDELLEGVPLVELMERSIDDADHSAVLAETDRKVSDEAALRRRADELVALQSKRSLASRLDMREARRLRDASDERRLQPRFVQRFFMRAYQLAGGTVVEDKHSPVYHVGRAPSVLLEEARRRRLPVADRYDTPFVFDKNLVSVASAVRVPEHTKLLGPGHPLFDAVIHWAIRRARDAFARGAVLVDPNVGAPQRAWLVHSVIDDERREEKKRVAHEQLSLVLATEGSLRCTSPANLLNCAVPESPLALLPAPDRSTDDVQAWAWQHITEEQRARVAQDRQTECAVRREYLETTFTDLILELQGKLNEAQRGQLFGDDDPEERRKLERRIEQLKERKAQRLAELELMERLSANLPEVVTSALIVPEPAAVPGDQAEAPPHGVPMRRDDEVERIAMDVSMAYERARGWTPHDVSGDGEHYDVRSESPTGEIRFIEVKGRARSGAIVITGPEVDKLQQLGDRAFLYVVTHCKGEAPRLRIIQDPMSQLSPEVLYRQVQYIVDEGDWQQKGEEVDALPATD